MARRIASVLLKNVIRNAKNGFVENTDYIYHAWTRDDNNLRYRPVKLTESCFIEVAMMAPGDIGKNLRRHYIWLEGALKAFLKKNLTSRSGESLNSRIISRAKRL